MIFCQTPALSASSAARLAICPYQSVDAEQSTGILSEGLLHVCPRQQKPAARNSLTALASCICGLFGALQKVKSRRISKFRTLSAKHRGWGYPPVQRSGIQTSIMGISPSESAFQPKRLISPLL